MHTRVNVIVFTHYVIRPPAPWSNIAHTLSHYHGTKQTSLGPILIMPVVRFGSDEYQFYNSLTRLGTKLSISHMRGLRSPDSATRRGETKHLWWPENIFVVVLRHSNSISFMSWWWYDAWDEEEKAWAYTFTNSRDLWRPTPHRHGVRGTGLRWCCKLCSMQQCVAAQLNVMAVTGCVSLSAGSPTQCLNQLSYIPTL